MIDLLSKSILLHFKAYNSPDRIPVSKATAQIGYHGHTATFAVIFFAVPPLEVSIFNQLPGGAGKCAYF